MNSKRKILRSNLNLNAQQYIQRY